MEDLKREFSEPPTADALRARGMEPDEAWGREWKGERVYLAASMPHDERTIRQHRLFNYARFSRARQFAGGEKDPIFLGGDADALAAMDPHDVALLEVEPEPGAVGYEVPYEHEWRVHTGTALKITKESKARLEEAFNPDAYRERLHPRNRKGQWREKLDAPRLDLKPPSGGSRKKLTQPQVHARAKKVVKALVDFYGGETPEVSHQPEYLGDVGSDARFRRDGEALSGVLYGRRVALHAADPEFGVHEFRMLAHEAAHSLSGVQPGPLPGISQTVEEGAAEVLSLWFWKHRGQEMDERDAVRVGGRWTRPGIETLVYSSGYRDETAEVIRRAASKVGWERAAIVAILARERVDLPVLRQAAVYLERLHRPRPFDANRINQSLDNPSNRINQSLDNPFYAGLAVHRGEVVARARRAVPARTSTSARRVAEGAVVVCPRCPAGCQKLL